MYLLYISLTIRKYHLHLSYLYFYSILLFNQNWSVLHIKYATWSSFNPSRVKEVSQSYCQVVEDSDISVRIGYNVFWW